MYIDTHCHLDFDSLKNELPELLQRAKDVRVCGFVVPGVSPEWWGRISSLAGSDNAIMPAFGIHPLLAHLADDATLKMLSSFLGTAVAVGEVGLDYTVREPSRSVQQESFRRQLRLAVARGLPVLVHCRGGFADLLQIMKEEGADKVGGIMHAYSGSPEVARDCIQLGFYISVCGTVTFRNAVRPPRVVREIPLERLVLETDSPDIAPEPFCGRTNEPSYILETARVVAGLKGVSLKLVEDMTTTNALHALRIVK